jgi:hypothetical protein
MAQVVKSPSHFVAFVNHPGCHSSGPEVVCDQHVGHPRLPSLEPETWEHPIGWAGEGGGVGVPQNDTLAFNWFCKAAKQGHVHAQYRLGYFFLEGRGMPQKNSAEAAAWFAKAAEQGHHMALQTLCYLYISDASVPQDKVEACFWHELFISNWDERAAMKARNDFPAKLSSNELADVQERVAEWISAHQSNNRE